VQNFCLNKLFAKLKVPSVLARSLASPRKDVNERSDSPISEIPSRTSVRLLPSIGG